jgi:hypothetical protein
MKRGVHRPLPSGLMTQDTWERALNVQYPKTNLWKVIAPHYIYVALATDDKNYTNNKEEDDDVL